MIDFAHFNSLIDIALYFDTPIKCKKAIAQSRWADGDVVCPYCGQHHCHTRKDGKYICSHCHCTFTVTVGTIFENTKISLFKWFMAMYLISSHKKGVSSAQLARDIHVTQKTAWFILHKFRRDEIDGSWTVRVRVVGHNPYYKYKFGFNNTTCITFFNPVDSILTT